MAQAADITESEWTSLSKAWPPVVQRDDGSLLVISGIYSFGKRHYAYSTVSIAGLKVSEAVGRGIAIQIASARGKDVKDYVADADTGWDGTWNNPGVSRIQVVLISPGVPVRVKIGDTYYSSRGVPHGDSDVHFYGGPESAAAYRVQSARYIAQHGVALDAPAPPTPRQAETLQKFAERAQSWGLGAYTVPQTAVGAKKILDALAANNWHLRPEGYGPDPLNVWDAVLRQEKRATQPAPPTPKAPLAQEYEEEI